MNENMNRFDYNTEGKICDYGCEEPKVLSEQEILEELNRLDQANDDLSSECISVNWTNECLEEEVEVLEKALELACKELIDDSCMRCNSCNRFEMCDYVLSLYPTSYFIEEAKEMMKSE